MSADTTSNTKGLGELTVSVQDGMFACTDGAGFFTRPATGDEKLLWAEIVRLRTEHEADLERMEDATQTIERLTRELSLAKPDTGRAELLRPLRLSGRDDSNSRICGLLGRDVTGVRGNRASSQRSLESAASHRRDRALSGEPRAGAIQRTQRCESERRIDMKAHNWFWGAYIVTLLAIALILAARHEKMRNHPLENAHASRPLRQIQHRPAASRIHHRPVSYL